MAALVTPTRDPRWLFQPVACAVRCSRNFPVFFGGGAFFVSGAVSPGQRRYLQHSCSPPLQGSRSAVRSDPNHYSNALCLHADLPIPRGAALGHLAAAPEGALYYWLAYGCAWVSGLPRSSSGSRPATPGTATRQPKGCLEIFHSGQLLQTPPFRLAPPLSVGAAGAADGAKRRLTP